MFHVTLTKTNLDLGALGLKGEMFVRRKCGPPCINNTSWNHLSLYMYVSYLGQWQVVLCYIYSTTCTFWRNCSFILQYLFHFCGIFLKIICPDQILNYTFTWNSMDETSTYWLSHEIEVFSFSFLIQSKSPNLDWILVSIEWRLGGFSLNSCCTYISRQKHSMFVEWRRVWLHNFRQRNVLTFSV